MSTSSRRYAANDADSPNRSDATFHLAHDGDYRRKGENTYLPADLDGKTLPPAGAPNTFVEFPSGSRLRYNRGSMSPLRRH